MNKSNTNYLDIFCLPFSSYAEGRNVNAVDLWNVEPANLLISWFRKAVTCLLLSITRALSSSLLSASSNDSLNSSAKWACSCNVFFNSSFAILRLG